MRQKHYQIWLLVGYLGLLLNLGESLHHADIFGLHVSDSASVCCHCCCGHSTSHDSSSDAQSLNPDHDCAFCKFFAQYHVTAAQVETPDKAEVTAFHFCYEPAQSHTVTLVALARGPPVIV